MNKILQKKKKNFYCIFEMHYMDKRGTHILNTELRWFN